MTVLVAGESAVLSSGQAFAKRPTGCEVTAP